MITSLKYSLLAIFTITFLVSCSSQLGVLQQLNNTGRNTLSQNQPNRSSFYDSEELRYFMEIALGSEYGVGEFAVKKWSSDIKIEIFGQPTAEDLRTLNRVMEDLNEIIAERTHLEIVPADGNVQFYFIPEDEFYQYEPPGIVYHAGFFWNWWNYAGEIYRSRVVIASDRVNQELRSHLIREELTQALGLMNDSMKYTDSIFYQRYSETTEYSALDRFVINLLYSDAILPGMTDFEVREVLSGKFALNLQ